ncbi:ATPase, P-type, HAD superfamily, protein (macronuclear) [Tetrahymena thermophila SB210]|uniref:ATPase, P-type, HAD superfamily, protein n=1 Tax=Tetrahymena thermophila (strain SB210) TaxID=312017 RepID=Q232B2_TETTS|nr:ATPase, P-type, HAD superfamily, protein [Tetrahymena thermophila SB210]EAR91366.3 ATPase, P-type, HAD superfamily, protein [Tetrahymena thermophila SB210]|eukprot:XP_001011611.3 ATPase, P-type, HAD superfamily, protein [Tetrahymena thermophila SB210]
MINLKKTIIKSLSLVFVEFACIFAFAIFQIPLPLSSFSILLIQILTDVIPTFICLNPKPSGRDLKKIYQKVEPVTKETFISSLFSVRVIASLIIGFVSYIYTFQSFGFSSVFGLANIKGYQPPAFQNKHTTGQEVFYNENLEKISRNCFENQDQTEQIKFKIDWLSQKQRHYDLRQVLLQCDPQTKKWVPSVKWGTCNTNLSGCYSTQAYYWAQMAFFGSVILLYPQRDNMLTFQKFFNTENNFDEGENFNPDDQDFQNLYKNAALSCNAKFVLEGDQNNVDYSTCKMLGGVSDQALLRFLHSIKNVDNFKKSIQYAKNIEGKAAKLELNSINKYKFSIVEEEVEDSHYVVYFEGAAEKIISLCQFYMKNNSKLEIDSAFKENVLNCLEQLGKKSERVLGFAKLHLPASQFPKGHVFKFADRTDLPFSVEKLTFQGLFSLKDQIKPEVKSVVEFAKQIGIRTILQTGDSQLTAQYTARAINILPSNIESTSDLMEKDPNLSIEDAINKTESILISGDQMQKLNEKLYINKQNLAFYRVTAEQKFQIVKNLQSNSEVVLAVGDGTNDAPALKRSDISLSMYKKDLIQQYT